MKSLPPVELMLPLSARRVFRSAAWSSLALLISAGLLVPAMTVRAQSESSDDSDKSVQSVPDPRGFESQPAPDETEVSTKPGFTIAGGYMQMPAEHSVGSGIMKTTSKNGYEGTVNYTCVLVKATHPSSLPALCAMYPDTAKLAANQTAAPQILIFGKGTKLPAGATLGSNGPPLKTALGAGGVVLACCLLFGIPARRRAWRSILSTLLLLAAIGGLSACSPTWNKITEGEYYFKVTGTDSTNSSIQATATVLVNVL